MLSEKLFQAALHDLGTAEVAGTGDNPTIVRWLRKAGITWGPGDETPWCSAYMYDLVGRFPGAERPESRRASAISWAEVGTEVPLAEARRGDIAVFERKGGYHVALFVTLKKSGKVMPVLGGNQGNEVCIRDYQVSKLKTIRRIQAPDYEKANDPTLVAEFKAVQAAQLDMFLRKNADYGNAFATFGPVGVMVRLGDKFQRLAKIANSGVSLVSSESLHDTMQDASVYGILGQILLRNNVNFKSPGTESNTEEV